MAEFTAVVRRIEEKKVMLETETGKKVVLPLMLLSNSAQVGQKLYIEIIDEESHEARAKNLAQALLNEILGDGKEQREFPEKQQERA